jgi:hypothetical protein
LLLSLTLLASSLSSPSSVSAVYKSLNISRLLQEKLKPQGEKGKKGPTDLPDYNGKAPPAVTDDWAAARNEWFELEQARLDAQKKFHNSEFQRYVLQEELNTKRKAITEDASQTIKAKVDAVQALNQEYQIKISEEDVIINANQNARTPANQRAQIASQKFWKEFDKSERVRLTVLREYKATPISVTRRNLQAVVTGYTADQKGCIERLAAAWKKQFAALEVSYSLNKKFHTVEFVEFELDGHRLEDQKSVFQDDTLSHWGKRTVWVAVARQYNVLRKEAATVINSANGARRQAQKDSTNADREVNKAVRDRKCQMFKWGTLSG